MVRADKRDQYGNIMITGSDIGRFRMHAIKHALSLDVNHGLKRRGRSILQIAREAAGQEFRTKKQALAWFEEHFPGTHREAPSTEPRNL